MFNVFKFVVLTNLAAAIVVTLAYFFIPVINNMKPVDLMFIVGVTFWVISTFVRIGNKRFKKEWQRNEVITTDPQIVLHANSIAAKFLAAGVPGIAGSIIWGTFFY